MRIESRLAQQKAGPERPRIGSNRAQSSGGGIDFTGGAGLHLGGGHYEPELDTEPQEQRTRRWAITAALVFHALLFLVSFPRGETKIHQVSSGQPIYMVEPVRFKPPAPQKQVAKKAAKKKAKKIPIPDPTPDDPEPLEVAEVEMPEIEGVDISDLLDVPPAPEAGGFPAGQPGPMWVEGDVKPPQKLDAPTPRYTEEARKARVQGVVILQAVIDALGNVADLKVVKGLPEGLDQSALTAVKDWKFRPATLDGQPVPVYYNLTIAFSLQ